MLKAKPLSDLLSQTLSPSLESAILFTKSGSLLAQALDSSVQNRNRVVAALATSLWSSSSGLQDGDLDGSVQRGPDWTCVTLEASRLFIQDIQITGSDLGVASEGLLLCLQGNSESHFGLLRLQSRKIKQYLESEFARVAG